jgi:hypothetical protein
MYCFVFPCIIFIITIVVLDKDPRCFLDPWIPGTSLGVGWVQKGGVTQAKTGTGPKSVEEGSSRDPVMMEGT